MPTDKIIPTSLGIQSSGFLNQRNARISLEANGTRILLRNVTDLTVSYNINTESVTFLGSTISQQYPTFASIEGTMTIEANHGIWLSLIEEHKNTGIFPYVNFTLLQPPSSMFTNPIATIRPSQSEGDGKGEFSFTLNELVFSNLPLVNLSTTGGGLTMKATVSFTANSISISNSLDGYDVLRRHQL